MVVHIEALSSLMAAFIELAAILALHFVDDFIGALELLHRFGLGVLLQQVVGVDFSVVNVLVFLDKAVGKG